MLGSFSINVSIVSKRSKRTSAGRGFGKQQISLQPEEMALFTATIFALQLATQKLAALNPSKTAKEWQDFLMGEAMEQILHNEEVGLLEETTDLESP